MRTLLVLLLLASGGTDALAGDDLRADLEQRVGVELEAARRTAAAEEHYRRGLNLARTGRERGAAEEYGLRLDGRGDERHDLLKSARAAAGYLRDLYELLGDWTLAIAAYNAGEYRVLRAVQSSGGRNFWSVRHLLPRETADYVPRVLAAIRIAQSI